MFCLAAAFAQTTNVASTTVPSGPVISFDNPDYNFGKISQGEPIRHDFAIKNTGDETLNITDVHPSCGCTTAGSWPHELAPGASGIIPIEIHSANLGGDVTKTVTVTSNDKHSPTILKLMGKIFKSIELQPSYAMFHLISGSTNVAPAVVKIFNRTEEPLKILSAKSDSPAFTVGEVKTVTEGKEFEISVTAEPPLDRSANGTIVVTTSVSNSVVRIPAYLTVQQAIWVQPRAITVPANLPKDMQENIQIYSMRQTDTFSDATSSDDRVTVTLTNSMPGRSVYLLRATIPAGYQANPGHPAFITVKTTDAKQPLVTIPIQVASPTSAIRSPDMMARQRPLLPVAKSQSVPPPVSAGAH